MGETGGKIMKGRIQEVLTDKDFPGQNDSRLQRGLGYLKPEEDDAARLLTVSGDNISGL